MYTCFKCGIYKTNRKTDLQRHLNRKRSCVKMTQKRFKIEPYRTPNERKLNPIEPQKRNLNPTELQKRKYECCHCFKTFSTNSHMHRHMKHHCKENDKNKKIRDLEKRLVDMEDRITKITTTNHIQNYNTTVHIHTHGREDISHLGPCIRHLLTFIPSKAITEFIGEKYFDAEHPENHTVKITNKKDKWIQVHNNGIWELRLRKNVIRNMIDNSFQDLNDHYVEENLEEILPRNKAKQWHVVKETFNDGSMYKNHMHETEEIILNKQGFC